MVGLFGDILACTSSGWNEHTVCGGAASDVVDFVQSNALDFAKLICSRADATLVNNRMIIVCLAQNRCWLGALICPRRNSGTDSTATWIQPSTWELLSLSVASRPSMRATSWRSIRPRSRLPRGGEPQKHEARVFVMPSDIDISGDWEENVPVMKQLPWELCELSSTTRTLSFRSWCQEFAHG